MDKEYNIQSAVERSCSTDSPIYSFSVAIARSFTSLVYSLAGAISLIAFSLLGIWTAISLIFRSHIFWKRERPAWGTTYMACLS